MRVAKKKIGNKAEASIHRGMEFSMIRSNIPENQQT